MKKNYIQIVFAFYFLSFLFFGIKAQAQNIGIGTTLPTAKLHIFHNSSTTNPQLLLYENSTDYSRLNFMNASGSTFWSIAGANSSVYSNDRLNFYNSVKGDIMSITGEGRVGIGTTNPLYRLDVADRMLLRYGPSGTAGIWLNKNDNSGPAGFIGTYTDDNYIGIYGANGAGWQFFMNTATGNVGIHTIPVYPLDVTSNTSRVGNFVNTANSGNYKGVYGSCSNTPGDGTGVYGEGGNIGIYGSANLTGIGDRYGIFGEGVGGTYNNYGVRARAIGGTEAYGIYAYAASGTIITYAGYFQGDVYTTGSYQPSDRKLKNGIKPLSDALSIINQLNPSVYTYKTNEYKQMQLPEGKHYGLIADEVQMITPGIVKKAVQPAEYENHDVNKGKKISDEVEFNAVNYSEMIPILIGGMKEQQVMIEKQQKQIDGLLKEIQLIKEKLK